MTSISSFANVMLLKVDNPIYFAFLTALSVEVEVPAFSIENSPWGQNWL